MNINVYNFKKRIIFNCGFSTISDLHISSAGKHIRIIRNTVLDLETRQYLPPTLKIRQWFKSTIGQSHLCTEGDLSLYLQSLYSFLQKCNLNNCVLRNMHNSRVFFRGEGGGLIKNLINILVPISHIAVPTNTDHWNLWIQITVDSLQIQFLAGS